MNINNKQYLTYFDRKTTIKLISKWSCGALQMKAFRHKAILGGYIHQDCCYYSSIRKSTELRCFISGKKQEVVSSLVGKDSFLKMIMKEIFEYYISPVQAKDIFKDYFTPNNLMFWNGVEVMDIN
jgi:hypothetical protein